MVLPLEPSPGACGGGAGSILAAASLSRAYVAHEAAPDQESPPEVVEQSAHCAVLRRPPLDGHRRTAASRAEYVNTNENCALGGAAENLDWLDSDPQGLAVLQGAA